MCVYEGDNERVIFDKALERLIIPQEIQLLVRLSAKFGVVGWHGDFDLNQPFDTSPAAQHMLCLLQKL
ncbi:MAG: hypothetical protein H6632_12865 [Anaerolineales bacterium]|nr:hypothetical protein [Anaerolineales bacterium]